MANLNEDMQKKVGLSISKWLDSKKLMDDERETYQRCAEAVLQTLESRVVQTEEQAAPEGKLSKLLPVIQLLIMAFSALLGAKLGGPLGAFAGVSVAAGTMWLWLRYFPKCGGRVKAPVSEPVVELDINGDELDRCLAEIQFPISSADQKQPVLPDLLSDEGFHRWSQQFALKVHRKGDYNDLQMLMSIKDVLENFGLYLYDELEKDDDGNVVLPPLEDSFMDMREGDEWTTVVLPIVYTRDKVLLCGVIK